MGVKLGAEENKGT